MHADGLRRPAFAGSPWWQHADVATFQPVSGWQHFAIRTGDLQGRGGRVGEAANPGPATVVVANVTSLKGAWAKLLTAESDLLVVQEARCTAAELETMARQQNRQAVYGAEVDGCVWSQPLLGKEGCRRSASAQAAWLTISSGKWVAIS
jgi:hypothetical protein